MANVNQGFDHEGSAEGTKGSMSVQLGGLEEGDSRKRTPGGLSKEKEFYERYNGGSEEVRRPRDSWMDQEWFRKFVGVDDIKWSLWRALAAEFVGTLFLVWIGTGSTLSGWFPDQKAGQVQISLTFGIVVIVLVAAFAHVSGSVFNPALTCGLIVSGDMSVLKAIFYMIAQFVGGIIGSVFLKAVTPPEAEGNLGSTFAHPSQNGAQAMFTEALMTFMLMLTVLGTTDKGRGPEVHGAAAGAIGFAVLVSHLAFIPATGASLNPARSLGPAVFYHNSRLWVYFVGPILGAVVAGLLYRFAFRAKDQKKD